MTSKQGFAVLVQLSIINGMNIPMLIVEPRKNGTTTSETAEWMWATARVFVTAVK